MANKIYLGTVWVNGEKQAPVASYARIAGDDNVVPIIEVKDSEDNDHNILWVICHGKLLAAEPLLVSISYDDLLLHGYLFGQPVTIDGQEFNIRMVRDFEEWTEFGSVGESAYALHGTGTLIGGPVDTTRLPVFSRQWGAWRWGNKLQLQDGPPLRHCLLAAGFGAHHPGGTTAGRHQAWPLGRPLGRRQCRIRHPQGDQ